MTVAPPDTGQRDWKSDVYDATHPSGHVCVLSLGQSAKAYHSVWRLDHAGGLGTLSLAPDTIP